MVTREVSATGGLVHLSGEDWSARPYDEDLVIPPGVRVDVFEIEGATALVHPREPLPDPRTERSGERRWNCLVPIVILAGLVAFVVASAVRIVPQARRYNIERFGRYQRTLQPGLNVLIPLVDRVNTKLDVREHVYSSDPKSGDHRRTTWS